MTDRRASKKADLKKKLVQVPKEPGVYLMKDQDGSILYVGKAKSLKVRLSHYFGSIREEDYKTQVLINQICDFEIIIVSNESEALLVERNLIKLHKPPFNILLKDDKSYPFIRVSVQEKWPRVSSARKVRDDGALYVGPFPNSSEMYTLLNLAFQIFPLIRCSPREFKNASRPCNYYHMKKCLAPCSLDVSEATYADLIKDVVDLVKGRNKDLKKSIEKKMWAAAEKEQFELAATHRNQMRALDALKREQSVVLASNISMDVIATYKVSEKICFYVLSVLEGRLLKQKSFVTSISLQTLDEAYVEFMIQLYTKEDCPQEILIPFDLVIARELENFFKENYKKKVVVSQPQRGHKYKLLQMAERNAKYSLEESLRRASSANFILEALQHKLSLTQRPSKIECLDISNLGGTAIVASIACFVDAKPEKSLYRKYRIVDKTLKADDFLCISEVVTRRYTRMLEEHDAPDLLIIDGGKGQLHAAIEASKSFPNISIPIISLAKSRSSHEGDQVSYKPERVFLPEQEEPIELDIGSPEYRILTQIRDETHRFAVKYHRTKRSQIFFNSLFDDIPGIGPIKKKKLLKHFQTVKHIEKATIEEIRSVAQISLEKAENIKRKLQK